MSTIESFQIEIPQLKRNRIVWVYLPDGYDQGDGFPVIYMHDGQNCFFDRLATFGRSWRVGETMDDIASRFGYKAIVVAVENDDRFRLSEYSPWKINFFAFKEKLTIAKSHANRGGEGEAYTEFFVKTLKNEIDSRYKTERIRQATAIVGSSMGGLISCYAALKYPKVYSHAGLFSTYTLFNQAAFDFFIRRSALTEPLNAFIYCGGNEADDFVSSKQMTNSSSKLYRQLTRLGVNCRLVFDSPRPHNEESWGVHFYDFALAFLRDYYSQEQ